MDKCMWVAAGYPPLLAAIAALWLALQKSQEKLLKEREDTNRIWGHLRNFLNEKTRGRKRGGSHGQKEGN